MPHVFTLPEILSLARKPEADLARDDSDTLEEIAGLVDDSD